MIKFYILICVDESLNVIQSKPFDNLDEARGEMFESFNNKVDECIRTGTKIEKGSNHYGPGNVAEFRCGDIRFKWTISEIDFPED